MPYFDHLDRLKRIITDDWEFSALQEPTNSDLVKQCLSVIRRENLELPLYMITPLVVNLEPWMILSFARYGDHTSMKAIIDQPGRFTNDLWAQCIALAIDDPQMLQILLQRDVSSSLLLKYASQVVPLDVYKVILSHKNISFRMISSIDIDRILTISQWISEERIQETRETISRTAIILALQDPDATEMCLGKHLDPHVLTYFRQVYI